MPLTFVKLSAIHQCHFKSSTIATHKLSCPFNMPETVTVSSPFMSSPAYSSYSLICENTTFRMLTLPMRAQRRNYGLPLRHNLLTLIIALMTWKEMHKLESVQVPGICNSCDGSWHFWLAEYWIPPKQKVKVCGRHALNSCPAQVQNAFLTGWKCQNLLQISSHLKNKLFMKACSCLQVCFHCQ